MRVGAGGTGGLPLGVVAGTCLRYGEERMDSSVTLAHALTMGELGVRRTIYPLIDADAVLLTFADGVVDVVCFMKFAADLFDRGEGNDVGHGIWNM